MGTFVAMKTERTDKVHIGIFGKRNQGKSSLMNALIGQEVSIVSPQSGTTTDTVKKSLEILDAGAVVLIDTAGWDDEGVLGEQRIAKMQEQMERVDLALILLSQNILSQEDEKHINEIQAKNIPFIFLHSFEDKNPLQVDFKKRIEKKYHQNIFPLNLKEQTQSFILLLFDEIKKIIENFSVIKSVDILSKIIGKNDVVLLITPIDSQAPKGRLILPQVQLLRQSLDAYAVCVVCQEEQVESALASLKNTPCLAITDSQIFDRIHKKISDSIPLTSFSICLAFQKGIPAEYIKNTPKISSLKDHDKVLILESCTHQSNCDDIGRVKIPNAIRKFTQKNISFEIISALDPLPKNLSEYAMAIQCGACMITQRQLQNRLQKMIEAGVPISNYGMTLAYVNGIFAKAIRPFLNISE